VNSSLPSVVGADLEMERRSGLTGLDLSIRRRHPHRSKHDRVVPIADRPEELGPLDKGLFPQLQTMTDRPCDIEE